MKKLFIAIAALAAVTIVAANNVERTPSAFTDIEAKVSCGRLIKKQLRDPDSYRVNSVNVTSRYGTHNQYGSAQISFRSKNGFGGYTSGIATCTAFEKDGDKWHRAVIN